MKVFKLPKEIPAPVVDYANYDRAKEGSKEEEHKVSLKNWLVKSGFNGKHTGEIIEFSVADGSAEYMFADGPKSCLIHLPYGDAYQYHDVSFLPKKEILARIQHQKKLKALFNAA